MTQEEFADSCRLQADWCRKLGSPLYESILLALADDATGAARCRPAIEAFANDPRRSLLPLRLLAGLHRMVLRGDLPMLARYYPSAGGIADVTAAPRIFLDALESQPITIPRRVQTNEIARCCALLPGFLEIARRARSPLRLLEIGCSAGLNLRWDRYCYSTSQGEWGDRESAVRFPAVYSGKPLDLGTRVEIAERRGCDLNPIDATSEEGRLDLLSFVWADQAARFQLLEQAIGIARRVAAQIEQADAAEWLVSTLAAPARGVATVVFHSIVMLYLNAEQRGRVAELIRGAGERANDESPLAWLRMENGGEEAEVWLEYWPGGEQVRIAEAGFHGRNVKLV